jgi:hypothetical protein
MSRTAKWGKELDRNLFASSHLDRLRFAANGADANSVVGDPQFANPATGDFTVRNAALASQIGFKNFPMHGFGVQKPALKALAETPAMPKVAVTIDPTPRTAEEAAPPIPWMGAQIRRPRGQEMSAYGVSFDTQGVAVEEIDRRSALGGSQGLRKGDLILELNGHRITGIEDLRKALEPVKDGNLRLRVIRGQQETTLELEVNGLRSP